MITEDATVLSAIAGYQIPFTSLPPPRVDLPAPTLSPDASQFCDWEIDRLLKKGAIARADPSPDLFLSSFFLIEKSSGGMRFILNLKDLNSYIEPPHFKLEDWRMVVQLMLPNVFMATLDIEDAYLLVKIHPSFRKYLCFKWRNQIFWFLALPFGLSTAPFIFTKIMRAPIAFLREENYQSVVYLDDCLLLGFSELECRKNLQAHINLLTALGFIINFQKSELEPSTERKYLGFIFNSEKQTIAIPGTRRQKLYSLVSKIAKKSACTIRDFASMIGSLNSICPAVRYGLLYTKKFEREKYLALLAAGGAYGAKMVLDAALKEDFNWWLGVLSDNSQANVIRTECYACEIFSDASLTGWGASCGDKRARGWWSDEERILHINALEIKAAYNALRCFASGLRDCEILLRIDNTTAIAYVNRFGSVQFPRLSELARDIWQWCEDRHIFVFASYIASAENIYADAESRRVDTDTEWSLSDEAFNEITREWGPFEVDLFASALNAKCNIYVSWLPDPGSWLVDAFTLSWSDLFFYCFPPFILIPRILRKIIDDRAEGVIVVPRWPSQPWFPLFKQMLISSPIIFKPSETLLSAPLRDRHPAYKTLFLVAGRLSGRRL